MSLGFIEKKLAEMAQGVLVGRRNGRNDVLFWLANGGLIEIRCDLLNNKQQVWLRRERHGVLLAEEENNSDYPTEALIAQVALGLMVHGVAVPERPSDRPKTEQMKYCKDWKLNDV